MRLYQKKMEDGEGSSLEDTRPLPNEVLLDDILNSGGNYDIKNLAINTEYSDFSPMFFRFKSSSVLRLQKTLLF